MICMINVLINSIYKNLCFRLNLDVRLPYPHTNIYKHTQSTHKNLHNHIIVVFFIASLIMSVNSLSLK